MSPLQYERTLPIIALNLALHYAYTWLYKKVSVLGK